MVVSSVDAIVLRSVSGRECVVQLPTSLEQVLEHAVRDLGFARESVKLRFQYTLQSLHEMLQKPLPEGMTQHPLDMSRLNTVCDGRGSSFKLSGKSAGPSSQLNSHKQSWKVVIVYGIPQRAFRHREQLDASSSTRKGSSSVSGQCKSTSATQRTSLFNRCYTPGPLAYPHCPDGLRSLAGLVQDDSTPGFFRCSFFENMDTHPTMQYIVRTINGNLVVLEAVMRQIHAACPTLFSWIEQHSHVFLRMLNRQLPTAQELNFDVLLPLSNDVSTNMSPSRCEVTLEGGQNGENLYMLKFFLGPLQMQMMEVHMEGGDVYDGYSTPSGSSDAEEAPEIDTFARVVTEETASSVRLLSPVCQLSTSNRITEKDVLISEEMAPSTEPVTMSPEGTLGTVEEGADAARYTCSVVPLIESIRTDSFCIDLDARLKEKNVAHSLYRQQEEESALLQVHELYQHISCIFMEALEGNLEKVTHEDRFRWVVEAARSFFAEAEDFYLHLQTTGKGARIFDEGGPESSLAGLGCRAALGRQLYDVAVPLMIEFANGAAGERSRMHVGTPARRSSHLRVGALRNLPAHASPLVDPCARWTTRHGPARMLHSLLQVASKQRSTIVWYTSHCSTYSSPQNTLSTVGYVIHENSVAAYPLPKSNGSYEDDEIAAFLRKLVVPARADTVSSALREEWRRLMQSAYRHLVEPLEGELPPIATTPGHVYVVDNRHTIHPKETSRAADQGAAEMGAARWFAGYSDSQGTPCIEKWCVTAAFTPWNILLAAEMPECWETISSKDTALSAFLSSSAAAPAWLSTDLQKRLQLNHNILPANELKGRHMIVLHESLQEHDDSIVAANTMTNNAMAGFNHSRRHSMSFSGLCPSLVGDIHVIDDCDNRFFFGTVTSYRPHRTTLFHNCALSCHTGTFFSTLYQMLLDDPTAPVARPVRAATLQEMKRTDAPWLSVEFSLLDYGGVVSSMALLADEVEMAVAPTRTGPPTPSSLPSPPNRRPSRSASTPRTYAETHAVGDLYEMMLQHIVISKPSGEEAVLDSLIGYLEASKDVLSAKVEERKRSCAFAPTATLSSSVSGRRPSAEGWRPHNSSPPPHSQVKPNE